MGQLTPLRINPGFNQDATRTAGEGGWYTGDKVRFRNGFPEVIGGWARYTLDTFLGTCRAMYPWVKNTGEALVGLGTEYKYYISRGGSLSDITPIRETTAAGDVTFSASNGSDILTVSDTSHGAVLGDFVTFSGAATLGGVVTDTILNAEHQITKIVNANSYEVTLSVTANASDTGNGGASVVGAYQINIGLNDVVLGLGWGSDPWSDGAWGEAGVSSAGVGTLRVWAHDNFGEDLIINPRDGGVFYWDSSAGYSSTNRAVALADLSGATAAPTVARWTLVSDVDRHVICFGCDDQFAVGTQDPLLIRWSDQEDAANWNTASTTTTAGSLRLSGGSEIITAIQTKREIVIFTDSSMHAMQYLGAPYTFGIQDISRTAQLAGPKAVVAANDVLYWMDHGKFMRYDGMVSTIPCPISDYIFSDYAMDQKQKVNAGHNPEFSEVWWFYPSLGADDNDLYVVYNYEQNIWYSGTMVRTAWAMSGILDRPIAAALDGYVYSHENGMNNGEDSPATGISAYIESSAFDIQDGDRFFFARRLIPDLSFRTSTSTPSATVTLKAFRFPGSGVTSNDDGAVSRSVSLPVEEYTDQLHIRLRGRAFTLRVESQERNTSWRLGLPRIELRTDGKR